MSFQFLSLGGIEIIDCLPVRAGRTVLMDIAHHGRKLQRSKEAKNTKPHDTIALCLSLMKSPEFFLYLCRLAVTVSRNRILPHHSR